MKFSSWWHTFETIVEDDVWIGHGAIIIAGVKIGKGSVIAVGSIVTKDIVPYSVVGGNPTKINKYRFTQEEIFKHEKILNWFQKSAIWRFYNLNISKSGNNVFNIK